MAQSGRTARELCPVKRVLSLELRAALPATRAMLLSSILNLKASQMRLFPGMSRWFFLVGNSTAPRVPGGGLGDHRRQESAHGGDEAYPCVWNDSTYLKINNPPLTCSSECSLAFIPPGSASHDCDGLASQEECTATCAESYEPSLMQQH